MATTRSNKSRIHLMPGTWHLHPERSEFGFRVGALPPARGKFSQGQAELVVGDDRTASVSGTVQVDSLHTGLGLRDKHLRSKHFFDAANHPEIKFAADQIVQDDDEVRVQARLTIRGITRPVELVGQLHVDGDPGVAKWHLTGQLKRRDFNVAWMPLDRMMIGGTVTVKLDLVTVRH